MIEECMAGSSASMHARTHARARKNISFHKNSLIGSVRWLSRIGQTPNFSPPRRCSTADLQMRRRGSRDSEELELVVISEWTRCESIVVASSSMMLAII